MIRSRSLLALALLPLAACDVPPDQDLEGLQQAATTSELALYVATTSVQPDPFTTAVDWVHWGKSAVTDVNKITGGPNMIKALRAVNGATFIRSTESAPPITWDCGTPTRTASNVKAGVGIKGKGKGIGVSVSAPSETLWLYVWGQVLRGEATVTARLSDGSAPAVTQKVKGLFRLQVSGRAASPGANMDMDAVLTSETTAGAGQVVIYGAKAYWAERAAGDPVSLSQPGGLLLPGPVDFTATAWPGQTITKMELFIDGTLVATDTTAPYTFRPTLTAGTHLARVKSTLSNTRSFNGWMRAVGVYARADSTWNGLMLESGPRAFDFTLGSLPSSSKVRAVATQHALTHPFLNDERIVLYNRTSGKAATVMQSLWVFEQGALAEARFMDQAIDGDINNAPGPSYAGTYNALEPLSIFRNDPAQGPWRIEYWDDDTNSYEATHQHTAIYVLTL